MRYSCSDARSTGTVASFESREEDENNSAHCGSFGERPEGINEERHRWTTQLLQSAQQTANCFTEENYATIGRECHAFPTKKDAVSAIIFAKENNASINDDFSGAALISRPAGKTVPAFSRHYSCENTPDTSRAAHGLASLALTPLVDSRYAGFPLLPAKPSARLHLSHILLRFFRR